MLKTVISFLYLLFSNDISARKRKNNNIAAGKEMHRDAELAARKAKKISDERKIMDLRSRALKGDITAHGEWLEMIKIARKDARK